MIGIANENSIAYGCARAFRSFGAELAITYLNDKAKPTSSRWRRLEAPIFMPLDVQVEGQLEAVFEEIERRWGRLDFALHSIAFAPRADLHGRVVDCSREGFLLAMDVSCHSFIRMARLAEPLMKDGGALFTMSYFGAERVVENYNLMGRSRPRSKPRPATWPPSWAEGIACTRSRPGRSRPAPLRASRTSTSCSTRRRRARPRAVW